MILLWRVTERCNLRCPFCLYDRRLAGPRREADPAQVARMIALMGRWSRASGREAMLSWLGGEPLLWRPLAGLSALAREQGVTLSVTTNGTTLGSPAVRAALVRDYRELTVSVDGGAAFHDRMRGWRGAWDKLSRHLPALATERSAAGAPMRLRVNTVLMRQNAPDFPDLCRKLAEWGVDEISFNQLGGRDRPEFFPVHRLRAGDVAALAAALPALRAELAARGVALAGGPAYLRRFADCADGRPLPIADCRVAERFLFADEAGMIAPCSFTPGHWGVSVDDLRSPADLDALPGRFRAMQRARPAPDCADCPSTQQSEKWERLAA